MQSAMQKLNEWMTDNVSRGAELAMWERLRWTEINSGARVVRKDDLGNAVRLTVIESVDPELPGRATGSKRCCSQRDTSKLSSKSRIHGERSRTR